MGNAGFSFQPKKLTEAEFRKLVFDGPKGEAIMTFVEKRDRTDITSYDLDQMKEQLRIHLGYKPLVFRKRFKEAEAEHDRTVIEAKAAAFRRKNPDITFDGTLPDNYVLTTEGLFFLHPLAGAIKHADTFTIEGMATRGAHDDEWSILIKWTAANDVEHAWLVPRQFVGAAFTETVNDLTSRGLFISTTKDDLDRLKTFFGKVEVNNWLTTIDAPGWHDTADGVVFMLPSGEAFGPGAAKVYPTGDLTKHAAAYRPRGTLEEWQDNVGKRAIGNTRAVLAMSTALVGPLLKLVHEDCRLIHLFGGSGSGKTTFCELAASIWSDPDINAMGVVVDWNATANRQEINAARVNDLFVMLDEMAKAVRGVVGKVVYMFSAGAGKGRMTAVITARDTIVWRLYGLSNGELSLEAKILKDGEKLHAGQERRCISIPADAGKGMGIVETLHGYNSPAAFIDNVRHAAERYHGTAGHEYIRRLVEDVVRDEADLVRRVKAWMDAFDVPPGAASQAIDIARVFALIGAAGELAISYGVMPWPAGEAMRAAQACFEAAMEARGAGLGQAEAGRTVELVRRGIVLYQHSRYISLTKLATFDAEHGDTERGNDPHLDTQHRPLQMYGYRDERDELLFWTSPVALAEMSEQPVTQVKAVGRDLRDAGLLMIDQPSKKSDIETNMRRLRFRGGQRQWFYCVRGLILDGDA